jgi:general secretion pathway protein H
MIGRSDPVPTVESGFTLIELVVVLAILAIAAAMVVVRGMPVSPATQARVAAGELSNALRSARAEALVNNRSVTFTLDTASHLYQWGQQPTQPLPGDLQLALLTGQEQVVSKEAGSVRFDPDGGSSGGRITIAGGDRIWMVGVDWLTGRVSIEQKAP